MEQSARRRVTASLAAVCAAAALSGCFGGGAVADGTTPDGGTPRPSVKPTPTWDSRPASLAALGDSITRGFDACSLLADCPEASWATGSLTEVKSLTDRLLGGTGGTGGTKSGTSSWNLARSGARMADLAGQVAEAAGHGPEQITILMGANDACAPTTGAMTPVAGFRDGFEDAMAALHKQLPKAQVFVASIPDLERLWEVGKENPLATRVWKLGICPSMLGDADSASAEARARREAVRARVVDYNKALRAVCARYERCRHDDGAVFAYRFTADELSSWDWFHPSALGQARLARIIYQAAFG